MKCLFREIQYVHAQIYLICWKKVKTDFFEEAIAVDAWLDCICIPNRLEHSRLSAVMRLS